MIKTSLEIMYISLPMSGIEKATGRAEQRGAETAAGETATRKTATGGREEARRREAGRAA